MTVIEEILSTLKNAKLNKVDLSKEDIQKILKATKEVSTHQKMIESLIMFQSTFIPNEDLKNLTRRENQVLNLIGNGKTSKIIAKELNLSMSTIETHRKNIRKKTGLIGKGKLVRFAIINNLHNNK